MPLETCQALAARNIFSRPSLMYVIRRISRSPTCGTSANGRICKLAKVSNLRIHDLRHYATTVLFIKGIPDSIISKMTGHRSRELKRYQHLSPLFRQQTVELIAQELEEKAVTHLVAQPRLAPRHSGAKLLKKTGGADGIRTRDLRRDRPAF